MNTVLSVVSKTVLVFALCAPFLPTSLRAESSPYKGEIKAYYLDFNWAPTSRRGKPFAKLGL